MVTLTLGGRMRKLRTLLNIRLGPGAAILPPSITRLHLHFAYKINNGHMGPRKFWRVCLPRLKYHNPGVAVSVERTEDQEGPASLVVHFSEGASSSGDGNTGGTQVVRGDGRERRTTQKSINCKHRTETEIMDELMRMTDARQIEATEEDEQQLRDLQAVRERAARDNRRSRAVDAERKRERQILERARNTREGETLI